SSPPPLLIRGRRPEGRRGRPSWIPVAPVFGCRAIRTTPPHRGVGVRLAHPVHGACWNSAPRVSLCAHPTVGPFVGAHDDRAARRRGRLVTLARAQRSSGPAASTTRRSLVDISPVSLVWLDSSMCPTTTTRSPLDSDAVTWRARLSKHTQS